MTTYPREKYSFMAIIQMSAIFFTATSSDISQPKHTVILTGFKHQTFAYSFGKNDLGLRGHLQMNRYFVKVFCPMDIYPPYLSNLHFLLLSLAFVSHTSFNNLFLLPLYQTPHLIAFLSYLCVTHLIQ